VEIVQPNQINEAYKRLLGNDVKYRFVIELGRANQQS
jgi:D-arabinose 1-dehydrogenase-like Zn-dependent alcohol dehydrogenase